MDVGGLLGMTRGPFPSAAWTPSLLPSVAFDYFPSPTYCFSDVAGTIPCTDTDPVKCWKDRSGNNNTLTQSNLSLCPIFYALGGGKYVVTGDGVDDRMVAAHSASLDTVADNLTVGIAYAWAATSDGNAHFFCWRGSTGNNSIGLGELNTGKLYSSSLSSQVCVSTGANENTTPAYAVYRRAGSGADTLRKNAANTSPSVTGVTIAADSSGLTVFAINNGGTMALFAAYDCYGLCGTGANATGADLTNLETYLAALIA